MDLTESTLRQLDSESGDHKVCETQSGDQSDNQKVSETQIDDQSGDQSQN